jgi:cystathionine beta-lyase family protein involved in aluminum resistance
VATTAAGQGLKVHQIIKSAEKALTENFERVDSIALINHRRVLEAFAEYRLTEEHFAERTGYAINDPGREVMDKIYAHVMQAPAAAVRLQLVSGTHAIACALLGNLTPGDRMVVLSGKPYDTLHPVIGRNQIESGSLRALGIEYVEADIAPNELHLERVQNELKTLLGVPTKVIYIQKSCGYSSVRRTFSNEEIGQLCRAAKKYAPNAYALIDNCYGEFVEANEPTNCGADLVVGSLIKNPGGGLAICGGYIAGRKELVEGALRRLTAPGINGHLGVSYNQGRLIMQGLYLAPAAVANAVKGAMLMAFVFNEMGMKVRPSPQDLRFDIIQTVELQTRKRLTDFCHAVQKSSPVNAHVVPEPAPLPGYEDEVIMAGGTFIEGATIELSADGPLRPPYTVFIQAGLSYLHVKCMLENVLNSCDLGT